MRSILRQLSKYAEPVKPPAIEVPQKIPDPSSDDPILIAIKSILNFPRFPPALYEREVNDILALMDGYVPSQFVGDLFPLTLDVAYFLFYTRKKQITTEGIIDREFFNFLKTAHRSTYMRSLFENMEEISQRIFLARVLFATCKSDNKHLTKMDVLPFEYQGVAAAKLGCAPTIRAASNLIDYLTKGASSEQIILARIAYVAFWYWANNRSDIEENVGMLKSRCLILSAPKDALPPPKA